MRSAPRLIPYLAAGWMLLAAPAVSPSIGAEAFPPARETVAGPRGEAVPQATRDERRFVELANRERARRGLSQLEIDPVLITVARQHSAEMRDRRYFDHNSPVTRHSTPMDRYRLVARTLPTNYACVGENLFYCTVADVQRGHDAFMTSPTHRENVLFPRFEKIGVGIVRSREGHFWVTQMFLTNTPPESVARNATSRSDR